MPGPDLYTLRGWIEVQIAADAGLTVDAAHALLTDAAADAFGPQVFDWVAEELAAEGRDPDDLAALVRDDRLADRVLTRLRERMADDEHMPDFAWSAYPPDDPAGGRKAFRRAVRGRRAAAERALWSPRRPRVAGPRATGGRA
jgi:hypothetical protein